MWADRPLAECVTSKQCMCHVKLLLLEFINSWGGGDLLLFLSFFKTMNVQVIGMDDGPY